MIMNSQLTIRIISMVNFQVLRKLSRFVASAGLLLLISQGVSADQNFGKGADMSAHVDIPTVLSSPEKYLNRDITVKGAIVKVCRKRGCWVELAGDKKYQSLVVKVRDGEMVFPLDAMGKDAYATGKLVKVSMNLKQARNYLAHRAEENNEAFDPASVTEPMVIYRLSPTGVTIVD